MPPDNPFAASSGDPAIQQHTAVARVREALGKAGIANNITVMPEATHTAQAAANALGCNVAEIAKSIIFRAQEGRAVLVITSGANRVDDRKVMALIGQPIGKADADFVRTQCGFVIGGVAPIGHLTAPIVLMDEDLIGFTAVWPAAGHPNTMFRISPHDLARIAHAQVADVAQRKST